MKLHIAHDLDFPLDAVTQTFAAIGRKGAGKTYLASMLAEQMLDADAQVVVLDAVGNWWGLRVAADGKSKGKDIFVVGGEHGDIPLVPEAGAKVARLLVEKRISVVLDISNFRIGERKRFATDFAEEFFHLKKTQRSPVHVFIEEAQLFVPQKFMGDEARMYGAFEVIVRIGRNYGIGATLITQRPQSVNKEVLSQVECLCVLQVNGTHERKALEEWVQEVGADRKLIGELPGLPQGEGFVWSPSWLRIFKRVRFAKKVTFDASATPEVGKATKAARLSEVDVESLRESLSEVIAQAEKDDPKALRRRISELEREISKRPTEQVIKIEERVVEVPVILPGQITDLRLAIENLRVIGDSLGISLNKAAVPGVRRPEPTIKSVRELPKMFGSMKPARQVEQVSENGKLRAGAERMLAALCQWYPESMSFGQMRSHAGMKKSGTFSTYLSDLRRGGYIEEHAPDALRATEQGIAYFGGNIPQAPSTTDEVLAIWRPKLRDGARRILDVLVKYRGGYISHEQLTSESNLAKSGTYSTYLSDLRRARLIESGGGEVRANKETLFL